MSDSKAIKDRLFELRTNAGLTQTEVAHAIGIEQGTYSGYEKGNKPSKKNLIKIIEFYKITKEWLLTGEGEKSNLIINEPKPTLNKSMEKRIEQLEDEVMFLRSVVRRLGNQIDTLQAEFKNIDTHKDVKKNVK